MKFEGIFHLTTALTPSSSVAKRIFSFFFNRPASQVCQRKSKKGPVRFHSVSCRPDRPKSESSWLKIIATVAEATAIRPHSGTPRVNLISQVEDSLAPLGDSEEEDTYRSDSMKYCRTVILRKQCRGGGFSYCSMLVWVCGNGSLYKRCRGPVRSASRKQGRKILRQAQAALA